MRRVRLHRFSYAIFLVASLGFLGVGDELSATGPNRVTVVNFPTGTALVNGILPTATIRRDSDDRIDQVGRPAHAEIEGDRRVLRRCGRVHRSALPLFRLLVDAQMMPLAHVVQRLGVLQRSRALVQQHGAGLRQQRAERA